MYVRNTKLLVSLSKGISTSGNFLSSFLSTTNLTQIIGFPTFVQTNSNSKLDYTFTNIAEWYIKPRSIIPSKLCTKYHVCIELHPIERVERRVRKVKKIRYRIYTKDNLSDFAHLVDNFNWYPFFNSACIDYKVRYMNVVLKNAFEVSFPEKLKVINTSDNLWVTENLSKMFREIKSNLKNPTKLYILRKNLQKEIKEAKQVYNTLVQSKISSKKSLFIQLQINSVV